MYDLRRLPIEHAPHLIERYLELCECVSHVEVGQKALAEALEEGHSIDDPFVLWLCSVIENYKTHAERRHRTVMYYINMCRV